MPNISRPWCVVFISTVGVHDDAEVFEVAGIGCDGEKFRSVKRIQCSAPRHVNAYLKEMQSASSSNIEWGKFKEWSARYDVVISHNVSFVANRVKRRLSIGEKKQKHGSLLDRHVFACSMNQLDWGYRRCRKLSCLCREQEVKLGNMVSALERCRALIRLLGLEKLRELAASADVKYFKLTVLRIPTEHKWKLDEYKFFEFDGRWIRYATEKEVARIQRSDQLMYKHMKSEPIKRSLMFVSVEA